jgi:hypothetical protein
MIDRSAEASRRSSPTRSPRRPGYGNHRSGRRSLAVEWNTSRCRAGRRCAARRATRRKRNESDESPNDHVGRGQVRCDAPIAAPRGRQQPTLLQHERLHELPHRRSRGRRCPLRGLRLRPPPPLDRPPHLPPGSALGPPRPRVGPASHPGHAPSWPTCSPSERWTNWRTISWHRGHDPERK